MFEKPHNNQNLLKAKIEKNAFFIFSATDIIFLSSNYDFTKFMVKKSYETFIY